MRADCLSIKLILEAPFWESLHVESREDPGDKVAWVVHAISYVFK